MVRWERLLPPARMPVKRLTEEEGPTRFLTELEEGRLLDACRRSLRLPARFALYRGLRRNEVRALSWRWIDWEAGMMTVPAAVNKAKHTDTVPLNETALAVLREQAREVPRRHLRIRGYS